MKAYRKHPDHELEVQSIRNAREYEQMTKLAAQIATIADDCPAWLWDASHLACLSDDILFLVREWERRDRNCVVCGHHEKDHDCCPLQCAGCGDEFVYHAFQSRTEA